MSVMQFSQTLHVYKKESQHVANSPHKLRHTCSGRSHTDGPADSESQEGILIWLFMFEDSIHQRSAAALDALRQGAWHGPHKRKRKLRVMMLTGDTEATANKVAQQLHIDEIQAGLSPQQKLQVSPC